MDNLEGSSIHNKVRVADAKLCIDFHRCGKCLIEYDSLEEFICHKIGEHKCTLVLWESKKLLGLGLQIPSFIEFHQEENSIEGNEMERSLNQSRTKNVGTYRKKRGRPRKNGDQMMEQEYKATVLQSSTCCFCKATSKSLEILKLDDKAELEDGNGKAGKLRDCEFDNSELVKGFEVTTSSSDKLRTIKCLNDCNKYEDEINNESICPECGNIYKDPIVLKTHLKTVHCDSRPYNCKFDCPFSFKTKGSLMRHMRRHTGERPYVCKKCGRSFRESGALTRHMKSRFSCSTKTDNDLGRYGKTVKLDESEPTNETPQSTLMKHTLPPKILINDVLKTSLTNIDQIVYSSSSSAESGVLIEEKNDEVLKQKVDGSLDISRSFSERLDSCGDVNNSSLNVLSNDIKVRRISHISRDSSSTENYETMHRDLTEPSSKVVENLLIEDGDLKCSSCQQNFLRKLDFRNHLLHHLEGLPFRCIQCCYVCQSKQELVRHQRQKHEAYIDGASEKDVGQLKTHLLEKFKQQEENEGIQNTVKLLFRVQNSIEADELELSGVMKKPAKHSCRCHICLKRFSGSLYLSCHMGSHTGEKPYVCDICKKGFFLKDSLKKHGICHSEERKYKCGECYKPFKRLSHARDHLKIHSQDFPYKCSKCGKSFRWQASLKSHESSHDGPLPKVHLCSTCGRRFPSKWSLSRHQRSHSLEGANASHCPMPEGKLDPSIIKGKQTLNCISEPKIVCISDMDLQREENICIEEQGSTLSGGRAETYVFITQEDGSSCFVPTVAIVEELQDGTTVINNVDSDCS